MPKIEINVNTALSPETVLAAATEFSDKRLKYWPNISPKFYEVHAVQDTSADVTEGSTGNVWARELYDWSTPGKVVGTVKDSNIFHPGGTWTMSVTQREGGGAHINIVTSRQTKGIKGKIAGAVMGVIGKSFLTKSLNKTLEVIAADPPPFGRVSSPAAPPAEPAPPAAIPAEPATPAVEAVQSVPVVAPDAPAPPTAAADAPKADSASTDPQEASQSAEAGPSDPDGIRQ